MPKNKEIHLRQLPIFEHHGQLVTDSRDVAALIGKRHTEVMRSIKTMCRHFSERNFASADFFIPATYTDEQGKPRPCYYLTQMGCEMVANKQTGAAGTLFTAQYVKAFHAMKEFIMERNSPIWQDTRALTKAVRKQETDAIRELVEYATGQGSKHAVRYYTSISRIANKAAGITDRDRAHVEELTALMLIERVIAEEIRAGIAAGKPYKEIYTAIQQRLLTFGEITGTSTPCLTPHNAPHGTFAVGEYKTLPTTKTTVQPNSRAERKSKTMNKKKQVILDIEIDAADYAEDKKNMVEKIARLCFLMDADKLRRLYITALNML